MKKRMSTDQPTGPEALGDLLKTDPPLKKVLQKAGLSAREVFGDIHAESLPKVKGFFEHRLTRLPDSF